MEAKAKIEEQIQSVEFAMHKVINGKYKMEILILGFLEAKKERLKEKLAALEFISENTSEKLKVLNMEGLVNWEL